jgi:hypothetical protein
MMKNEQKWPCSVHNISLEVGSVSAKHIWKLESITEICFIHLYFVPDRRVNLFCKQIFRDAWTGKIFIACGLWKGEKLMVSNFHVTQTSLSRLIIYRCINKYLWPVRRYKSGRMRILYVRLLAELTTVATCDTPTFFIKKRSCVRPTRVKPGPDLLRISVSYQCGLYPVSSFRYKMLIRWYATACSLSWRSLPVASKGRQAVQWCQSRRARVTSSCCFSVRHFFVASFWYGYGWKIREDKFCRVASIITGMIHNGDTIRRYATSLDPA